MTGSWILASGTQVNVTAAHLALEDPAAEDFVQMELFADDAQREQEKEREALRKERRCSRCSWRSKGGLERMPFCGG